MNAQSRGFTLMEMIGVVAVIAILASMATPLIFQAISNARMTALAQDIQSYKAAVARFYSDTGLFPMHRPFAPANNQQLLRDTATGIQGWNGPYIEQDLKPPTTQSSASTYGIWNYRTEGFNNFDLDGDGNLDTSSSTLLYLQIPDAEDARRLSDILDGDGDVTSGSGAWFASGTVRRQNGADRYVVLLAHR